MAKQKMCANHGNNAAVSACHQCHKDLCKSCVMVTPAGTFCGSECSVLFREMKSAGEKNKKKGGSGLKVVVFLVLLVAGALFVVHLVKPGESYDILGKIMGSKAP